MKWLKVNRGMLNLEHVSFFNLSEEKTDKKISFYFNDYHREIVNCATDSITCELFFAIMKKIESEEIIIDVFHEIKQIEARQ